MIKRILTITAVVLGIVGAGYRARHRELPVLEHSSDPHPLGAFHVHSVASHDGQESLESIATAAGDLGFDFVVVTDHNRQLAGPIQLGPVTILSYAELSTPFGHVVALGGSDLPDTAEREHISVIRRIRELKGLPIATHPADPKRPWDGPVAHLGGVEIANLASSARRRGGPIFVGLLPTLLTYPVNRDLALMQIYDRDVRSLQRWDGESSPEFVGLCGTDTHGRPLLLKDSLRAWVLALETPLPSAPDDRPRAILETLKRGRFHCAAGLLGLDPEFEFAAVRGSRRVALGGGTVFPSQIDALVVTSPKSSSDRPTLVLFRNGQEVMRTQESELRYASPPVGTYRVEVRVALPGVLLGYRVIPVIYSNRLRVREEPPPSFELSPYERGGRVPAPLADTTLPAPMIRGPDVADPEGIDRDDSEDSETARPNPPELELEPPPTP
jgi:hypothetical protein